MLRWMKPLPSALKSYDERFRTSTAKSLTLTNRTRLVRANQDNLSHLAHELKTLDFDYWLPDLFCANDRNRKGETPANGTY